MPIVLYRIDERLIHGQVVVGWGAQLHPDGIVVVDDELAESEWEQELYGLGLPTDIEPRFVSVAAARAQLGALRESPSRVVLLTRDVDTMRRLADGGTLAGMEVNIGGIHAAAGRERVLPYIHLSPDEREQLRAIARTGAQVSARDLPATRRVPIAELLGDA